MPIQLSDHFTYPRLFRFTLPSIAMMVVTSIYSVVDGLFVSNAVGDLALAAVNVIYPLTMIVASIGFMVGTGGSAEVSRVRGTGDDVLARRYFTTLLLALLVLGTALSALSVVFIRPVSILLGADEAMLESCVQYGVIMMAGNPLFLLQVVFQSFLVTAERPKLGLWLSLGAGFTNMTLDWLFIVVLGWGVAGAAMATVCGYAVGALVPLVYFLLPNKSPLRLVRTSLYPRMLLKSCANGSSELMSNISASLVTILYNRALMEMVGSRGVAAYTVMCYLAFIFSAVLLGFSMGVSPIVSFHFGAGNRGELRSLFRNALTVTAGMSALMFLSAQVLAQPLAQVFVGYDAALLELTTAGTRIFAWSYLLCGGNIFGSAFFTALGDGLTSAAISFLRTLVFQVGSILLLPRLAGLDGVWWATPAAELLALLVTAGFLWKKRTRYHYA